MAYGTRNFRFAKVLLATNKLNWNSSKKHIYLILDYSNDGVALSPTSESPQIQYFPEVTQPSQRLQPSEQTPQLDTIKFNFGGDRAMKPDFTFTSSSSNTFTSMDTSRRSANIPSAGVADICHKPNIRNGQVISRDNPNIQKNFALDGEAVYVYCNRFLLNLEKSGNNNVVCRGGKWVGTFADCKGLL